MAVTDIFPAVTEVRPYRTGMSRAQTEDVFSVQVRSGGIDGDLVGLLMDNYDEIDSERDKASRAEGKNYYASVAGNRASQGAGHSSSVS